MAYLAEAAGEEVVVVAVEAVGPKVQLHLGGEKFSIGLKLFLLSSEDFC